MKEFFDKLSSIDLSKYGPVPFWSWNNRVEKKYLIEQIHQMKEVNCGGFILHARIGLKTEYLSEEWFDLVESCLDEAKKLNMSAWIYDENGWPSGFVGGKLLEKEENLACYLTREQKDYFDNNALAVFITDENGDFYRVNRPIASYNGIYDTIYVHRSPSNSDILNPDVVSQFIDLTHEEYYRRFKDRFGKEFVGFFTDEPQYFRWGTPFTFVLLNKWQERYGEDALDGIIHIFEKGEKHYPYRVRYYSMLNDLYVNNYYKRLYDWCNEHNCMLTGHSVEETNLSMQMWGGAGCTNSYEYEHIPAVDNLGRHNDARLMARQIGSACRQLGKNQVLTETFACSGYDVKPVELKAIAEKQYVHGVNMMCHHLFSYSLAEQGKSDHPPCFSSHMTWWNSFGDFNNYFTRLGYILANSKTLVNCVVINPIQNIYLDYIRQSHDDSSPLDNQIFNLIETLDKNGILYDFVDEKLLAKYCDVNGKKLSVGKQEYSYIIVPGFKNITATTKDILNEFMANGGKVLFVDLPIYTDGVKDDYSTFKSTTNLDEIAHGGEILIKTDGNVEYTYREYDGKKILYVVNVSENESLVNLPKNYSKFDLVKLTMTNVPKDLVLKKGEGIVLIESDSQPQIEYGEICDITNDFEFVSSCDNNLTLDIVNISLDGENYGEKEPLQCAFDRLLRNDYKGKVFIKFTFEVDGKIDRIALRREKSDYAFATINGKEIDFSTSKFDHLFEETDITNYIINGKNEYICCVNFHEHDGVRWALYDPEATESVRNCLWYDVMLENIYLIGHFSVDEDRVIKPFVKPSLCEHFEKTNFPYFGGVMTFKTSVLANKSQAKLIIDGKYSDVQVFINGKLQASCLFDNNAEIVLEGGKQNDIEIKVCSTLHNIYGPFHHYMEVEDGLSPFWFTYRGQWVDGKCVHYNPQYHLTPFGISSVKIAYEK